MRWNKTLASFILLLGAAVPASARVHVGIFVGGPPPPPRVVGPIGVAPGPGYVWTNGYWDWGGNQWGWVDGRWAAPPPGRRVWVDPVYHPYRGRYHYDHGYWR